MRLRAYSEVSVIEPVVVALLKEISEAIIILNRIVYIVWDSLPVGNWSGSER